MGVILTSPAVYPNLYGMFAELGIETVGIAVDCGASFGQTECFVIGRPGYGRLWPRVAQEAARFEVQLLEVLDLPPASAELLTPLRRLAASYSSDFIEKVLLPLLSLFIVARTGLLELPIGFVASYLRQVSLFSPTTWRLVRGGTRAYVRKLGARLGPCVRLDAPVARRAAGSGTEGAVLLRVRGR